MHASNRLPELTAVQAEYIEWLVDPERKGTQKQWCIDHGLTESAPRGWKRQPIFKRRLQQRLDELNLSPDRVQQVLDNMWRLATSSGREAVMAAKTYLQHVERLEPARKPIEDRAIKDLSQEELLQQLELALDAQRRKNVKAVNE